MKIIYINLYEGCFEKDRFQKTIDFINKHKPDVLGLSELNNWEKNNFQKLNCFKQATNLDHSIFCKAKTGYHLGLFSKAKLTDAYIQTQGLWHGAIHAKIPFQKEHVHIVLTHLSPYEEATRVKEIEQIKQKLDINKHVILMADLNSLSLEDNYDEKELIKDMKRLNISKFGTGALHFDTINSIQEMGLIDSFTLLNSKFEHTVPTTYNKDADHFTKLRLDYIFISNSLKNFAQQASVIRDQETNDISDHFPVTVLFR